jgi:hypothetical protein
MEKCGSSVEEATVRKMGTASFSTLLSLVTIIICTHSTASSQVDDTRKTCDPDTEICELDNSAPMVATRDSQIIEGLRIEAVNEPGILVRNLSNVVIRNVEIFHEGAHGISCNHAPGLVIENVSIIHTGARTNSAKENNISCNHSDGLRIANARLRGGSAGVYVLESMHAHLSYIEGYNFRGPDPRGQLVQFDKSPNCTLEDFSVINDPNVTRSADNISIYYSDHCVIRRGLLDGNNSPWSVGVMFEYSRYGLVEDVDTVAQGNGSFSAYPGHEITFRRTRARDNICVDQGRGKPMSNGLVWAGSPNSTGLKLEASNYFNLCRPSNLVWHRSSFDAVQVTKKDFSPRPAIKISFGWERDVPAHADP